MTVHHDMVVWWCEEAYPKQYGVNYLFQGGKEGTLLRRALGHLEKDFPGKAEETFKEAAKKYLEATDAFSIENKHPFGVFLSGIHKWVGKKKEPEKKRVPYLFFDIQAEKQKVTNSWQARNDEDWVRQQIEQAAPNPERYVRGFCHTQKILKKINPAKWTRLVHELTDLVGRDRLKQIAAEEAGGVVEKIEPGKVLDSRDRPD